jgi:DNA-binding transcriptional MerR regulator
MLIRIGALSERTGVSEELLRAWERRYGLLSPERTAGGFRLYSDEDLARVRHMVELLGRGLSASDAARSVLNGVVQAPASAGGATMLESLKARVHAAFREFDDVELEGAIDAVFAAVDLDTAAREVFVPALQQLGDDWASGRVSVAQEHFAVNVLQGRLMAMARGWDQGFGPRVLLACPEGELHGVSLVLFGLLARRRGWRVTFLGANTPLTDVLATQEEIAADCTVIFATVWSEYRQFAEQLAERATRPVALGGATAGPIAEEAGCHALPAGLVEAADALTTEFAPQRPARSAARAASRAEAQTEARRRPAASS